MERKIGARFWSPFLSHRILPRVMYQTVTDNKLASVLYSFLQKIFTYNN